MSDHKEKDTKAKKQREINRRVQLRRQQKAIEFLYKVISVALDDKRRAQEQVKDLNDRLRATQNLIPQWMHKFIDFP